MRSLFRFAACALGLAIGVSVASTVIDAQSFQGGLRGMVKDPQGVIPGVTITLINEQTKLQLLHQMMQADQQARQQRARERSILDIGSVETFHAVPY